METRHNQELKAKGREDDLLLAWRTNGEYWGAERTVVVTYNPLTATKQRYAFDDLLRARFKIGPLLRDPKSCLSVFAIPTNRTS